MSRLVILVSNDFRMVVEKLSIAANEFDLGKNRLLVHGGEEKAWQGSNGLRGELLTVLKTRPERSVRIVAHLSACFKKECDQSAFQVRVVEQEAKMRADSGIDDMEIWGFRHETAYSKLWNVLSDVLSALEKSKLDHEAAEQLDGRLDRAFSEATTQEAYEQITLVRHQILGLFVSARLNLEVAAERKAADGASLQRTRSVLPGKRAEAIHMLDEGMVQLDQLHRATASKLHAEKAAVAEVLCGMPALDMPESASPEFNAWLSRLDEALEKLRRRCR